MVFLKMMRSDEFEINSLSWVFNTVVESDQYQKAFGSNIPQLAMVRTILDLCLILTICRMFSAAPARANSR